MDAQDILRVAAAALLAAAVVVLVTVDSPSAAVLVAAVLALGGLLVRYGLPHDHGHRPRRG